MTYSLNYFILNSKIFFWVKIVRFKLLQEMLIWNDYRNHLTGIIFLKKGRQSNLTEIQEILLGL